MRVLSPISGLYGAVATARNRLYERGLLKSYPLGAHTVSIGNITAGGTGKTPLVAYTASLLADAGRKVCVLTRGYGRADESKRVVVSDGEAIFVGARVGGDEPVELAARLIGQAAVVADADRVAAAEFALREFGVTAFVLDDAFQHRRARRDVDVVCVDATDPFGRRAMLPSGRLREPIENLSRADAIVITRVSQTGDIEELRSEITALAPAVPIFLASSRIMRFVLPDGTTRQKPSEKVFAFCGIANPQSFFRDLENEVSIASTHAFGDHHKYRQSDIARIEKAAAAAGAQILATTQKDAVKLRELDFEMEIIAAEAEVALDRPDDYRRLVTAS